MLDFLWGVRSEDLSHTVVDAGAIGRQPVSRGIQTNAILDFLLRGEGAAFYDIPSLIPVRIGRRPVSRADREGEHMGNALYA